LGKGKKKPEKPQDNRQKQYNTGSWDKLDLSNSTDRLRSQSLLATGIPVKACAVWDTVSALGVPIPLGTMRWKTNMTFVEQKFPACLENAFQALALDEKRFHFAPVLWSSPPASAVLRQCWFLGSHSNVGGGYKDLALSNIPFLWMIAQLKHYTQLDFDVDTLQDVLFANGVPSITTIGILN
jgi:hypothetical protein